MTYTVEIEPNWDPKNNTAGYTKKTKNYFYTIELDAQGQIIGGEWLTQMQNGQFITLAGATDYLLTRDDNGDGQPDMTLDQVKGAIWQYFDFPDYVWTQERGTFPKTFVMPSSGYAIAFKTESAREALYNYFGKLPALYAASTGESCATDADLCP